MRLRGEVAMITGGASGIGEAAARLFAREGAQVVVVDRDESGAARIAGDIASAGGSALALACDVSDPHQVDRTVTTAVETFGRIDTLFNNAGIVLGRTLMETTVDEWDAVLATNLRSMFLMMRAVIPDMQRRGRGSIINTASGVGISPRPGLAAYRASKGGVIALSKAVATEVAAAGIRVNALCPGMIDTPMNRAVIARDPQPEQALTRLTAQYPLGRMGTADEVAQAALFLASSEASYVTGIALPVDGGRTLH